MTLLKDTTKPAPSNSAVTTDDYALLFTKVVCLSGSLDVRSGDIFTITGGDADTFTIVMGGEDLAVCAKTLTATKNGRKLEFKSLAFIETADSISIKELGTVIIGNRYGHNGTHRETLATHGKDALLIEDATVTVNGFDIGFYLEGFLMPDRTIAHKASGMHITNILHSVPLIQMNEDVFHQILSAFVSAYDVSVKKLSEYHRELILEHICKTNPYLRFQRYQVEDLASDLSKLPEYNDLSLTQLTHACQIVINNYDEYMPAYQAMKDAQEQDHV